MILKFLSRLEVPSLFGWLSKVDNGVYRMKMKRQGSWVYNLWRGRHGKGVTEEGREIGVVPSVRGRLQEILGEENFFKPQCVAAAESSNGVKAKGTTGFCSNSSHSLENLKIFSPLNFPPLHTFSHFNQTVSWHFPFLTAFLICNWSGSCLNIFF